MNLVAIIAGKSLVFILPSSRDNHTLWAFGMWDELNFNGITTFSKLTEFFGMG